MPMPISETANSVAPQPTDLKQATDNVKPAANVPRNIGHSPATVPFTRAHSPATP